MKQEFIDLELQLDESRIRLRGAHQADVRGPVTLDQTLVRDLRELENGGEHAAYGRKLFAALFPPGGDVTRVLFSTFDSVEGNERRLRLRLSLDPEISPEIQGLHWELMSNGDEFVVGRSAEIVFSRYVALPGRVSAAPKRPRLLCVIAAPKDSHRRPYGLAPIPYDLVRQELEAVLGDVSDKIEVKILDRPVTPERVREELVRGEFDLLHFYGHGMSSREGEAALVLEDDQNRMLRVKESTLGELAKGLRHLKLVTLIACNSGVRTSETDGLSGLSGHLIRSNVPAVIAMRRTIGMEMGMRFTRLLYRRLAQNPTIDVAVNEARHQLFLDQPDTVDWSSPILTMRLRDGRLWEEPSHESPPASRPRTLVGALVLSLLAGAGTRYLVPDFVVRDHWPHQQVRDPEPDPAREPGAEAISLEPIVPGRLAVGVVSSRDYSWSEAATRSLSRWIRKNQEGLQVVPVPKDLLPRLGGVAGGDLSTFPGGTSSPGGMEYLLLLLEEHALQPENRQPFPVVSLTCESILLRTDKPEVMQEHSVGHLGMAVSEEGALEQAYERCFEDVFEGLNLIR